MKSNIKRVFSAVIISAVLASLSACAPDNGGTAEVTAATTTAVPETTAVTTTAATEPPAVDDGFEHFWEMKFALPEGYEKDNFDLYNYYEYICCDYKDRNFFSGIVFDTQNSIFSYEVPNGLDGHVDYEYYCFLVEKFGAKSEKKEITVDGIKALQETVAIDMEDGFSTKLSAVTFETETAAYVISFEASGQESKEQLDIAFEAFNKMIKSIEINPEKRVPREFTDKLESLVGVPRTDGVPDTLPGIDFSLPENLSLSRGNFNKISGDSTDTYYYAERNFDTDYFSNCAVVIQLFDHEKKPLFPDCTEEKFRSLTDTDIQEINSNYRCIPGEYAENIKRLEIYGCPAVYFENSDGFKNCMIIFMENQCWVFRISDVEKIRDNGVDLLRYSDYIYGNLKIPGTQEEVLFTDDLSEYISDKKFPEDSYVYYHGGNIAFSSPNYAAEPDSDDENVLLLGGYWNASVAKYNGVPLELLDESYFRNYSERRHWDTPSEVEFIKRGRYKGYKCVIVKYSEVKTSHQWTQIQMYIDAEKDGKFVLTVYMIGDGQEERMALAKDLFGSVKLGEEAVNSRPKFDEPLERYITRKEYDPSEYTTVYDNIKIVLPEYLTHENPSSWGTRYRDKNLSLVVIVDKYSADSLDSYYLDCFYNQANSYPDVEQFRLTKLDGYNAVYVEGEFDDLTNEDDGASYGYHVLDVDGNSYRIRVWTNNLSEISKTIAKEILGSVRIEK